MLAAKVFPVMVAASAFALPLSAHAQSAPGSARAPGPGASRVIGGADASRSRPGSAAAAGGSQPASGAAGAGSQPASAATPGGSQPASAPASGPPASGLKVIVSPASPMAGQPVALVVTGAGADVTDYRWDLTGRGAYALDSGPAAQITAVFASAGRHRVAVQLDSPTAVERVAVVVSVASRQHRGHHGAQLVSAQSPDKVAPDPWPSSGTRLDNAARAQHGTVDPRPAATARARADAPARPARDRPRAISAGSDPSVTIADFHFAPGTTTVHVGDTVTWSNAGPSPHSATARNGTFNTGILHKGQSGSHTFTRPGTFSYFCTVHPFMHGTVVVLASSTPPTSGSSAAPASGSTSSPASGSSTPPGSGSSTQSASGSTSTPRASTPTSPPPDQPAQAQQLPMTGINLSAVVVTGLALVGLGLGLRRATSSR